MTIQRKMLRMNAKSQAVTGEPGRAGSSRFLVNVPPSCKPDKIRLADEAASIDGHKLRFVGFNGTHQGLSLKYTTYHFNHLLKFSSAES